MGKYQFQQGTWDYAAGLSGRDDLVGVDPRNASEEDQDKIADGYINYLLERYDGDPRYVASAWYAGETNTDKYKERGYFPTEQEEGGHPSVHQYVNEVTSRYEQSGSGFFEQNFNPAKDPLRDGAYTPELDTPKAGEASQLVQAKDKFLHNFFDSAFGGGVRSLAIDVAFSGFNRADGSPQPITQEDIQFVNKMFPNDFVTQKFILMNAKNPQHLAALSQMKKEDIERQQRVEQYGYGISTIASLGGMLLSDPTVLIPAIGQEAFILKGLSKMGKLAHVVPMNRWAKYGEIAATMGTLNVADRYGAEKWGGYKDQDYTSAFVLGAALGGGLAAGIGEFKRYRDVGTQRIVASTQNMQDHIAAQTTGARMPNEVPKTSADIETIHDPNFHSEFKSENLKTLMEGKKVYAVTRDTMKEMAKKWGVEFKDTAKAFYHDEGYAVIIKDNLKPGDNVDDILLHEVGVHGGMKDFVGEEVWAKILDTVDQNIGKNAQGLWKEAMRSTPSGGREEILAAYIELAGNRNNKFLTRLKGTISSKMRAAGVTKKISDDELIDFAHRSLQREVENVKGYITHADGSVTMGGMRYSNLSATNPNLVSDVIRTEEEVLMDTQGGIGKLAKTKQWFENGWFSGTIGGVLKNSKVKAVSDFANQAFHDARMRLFDGKVKPLELQKQEIMQELSVHWHSFIVARDKYLAEHMKGSRFSVNADDMRLDFNEKIIKYLNREYGKHKGNAAEVYDDGITQAANVYKQLYDAIPEIGKTSASRFGYSHKNIIDPDFKPSTGEIFRVFDPEQRHRAINDTFGSYEDFQKFMEDYAIDFADRPVFEKELLEKRQAEWDIRKEQHDKDVKQHQEELNDYNKKTLHAHQEKVKKIEKRYQEKVDKANKEWEKKVEQVKERDLERQIEAEDRWQQKVDDQWLHDEMRWEKMKENYQYELEFWKLQVSELPKGVKKPKKPTMPKRPSPPLKAQKPTVAATPLPPKPVVVKPQMPQKPAPPRKPPDLEPRPDKVSNEELDIHIKTRAHDFAYGMTDLDVSNLHQTGVADGGLTFFNQRYPMDTSGVKYTEKGIPFSYDADLRSYDLDNITNGIINRFAGEVAFRNYFPNPKDYDEWLQKVEQTHYGKGIDQKMITDGEKAKELKALKHGVAMLRGTNPPDDVKTLMGAFGGLTRKIAYDQNGANMGWNQVGESGAAIGYSGLRALMHVVPALNDFVRSAAKGGDHTQALNDTVRHVFGQNTAKEVWKTSWGSRTWYDRAGAKSKLRYLDKVELAANYMGKVTTTVNQMQRLTDWMITGARSEAIADSVEWAGGKQFSKLRNPFSASKLKAAGVDSQMAAVIKADIKKYTSFNSRGHMNHMNVAKWQQENPATYTKWRFLLDNQSMRTIQQATIGNTAYLTSAHGYSTFMKVLFQFKDFSLRAINGSTLRALTHREADDFIAAMGSMATNTAVYAGLTWGKSYMYFHDDEKKRKEYMAKQLSPGRLASAALLRGVMTGSILGFGGDIATAVAGTDSFRTTYDNTHRNMYKKDRDISDVFGDTFGQNPSARVIESGYRVLDAGLQAAAPHQQVTQRELSGALKAFPVQNALPMLWLNADLSKHFPTKDKKDDYWLWK